MLADKLIAQFFSGFTLWICDYYIPKSILSVDLLQMVSVQMSNDAVTGTLCPLTCT